MDDEIGRGTLAVWGGEEGGWESGATQAPVVFNVAFGYPDVASWLDVALGRAPGHIYSRNTNPTVQAFEEKVRAVGGHWQDATNCRRTDCCCRGHEWLMSGDVQLRRLCGFSRSQARGLAPALTGKINRGKRSDRSSTQSPGSRPGGG